MQYGSNIQDQNLKPDEYYFSQSRPDMLKFIPDHACRILDIGCGIGLFGKMLKDVREQTVWGIELDPKSAGIASKHLDKVLIGKIEDLYNDIPDNNFDCIVFNDVLEHLADPYSVLLKMKEKLNKDGLIVSSIPNIRYITAFISYVFARQWKYEDAGVMDKTHLRFFTAKSIKDMFEMLDFEIISIKGINPIKNWKFRIFNILTLGLFSDTRYLQYAAVVRKK